MGGLSKLILGTLGRGTIASAFAWNCNNCAVSRHVNRLLSVTSDSRNQVILPDKPKRPVNAYCLFFKDKYSDVVKEHEGSAKSNLFKVIGSMWHGLNEQQKQHYQVASAAEVSKYKHLSAQFKQSLTDEQADALKIQQKKKKSDKMKRKFKKLSKALGKPERPPSSGYNLFVQEMAASQSLDNKEAAQQFVITQSQKWSSMSDTDKKPYVVQAAKKKLAYEPLLQAWERVMIDQGDSNLVRAKTITKVKKKKTNISKKVTKDES